MAEQTFGKPAPGDAGQSGQTNQTPPASDAGNSQDDAPLTRRQFEELWQARQAEVDNKINQATSKAFQGLQSSNQKLANKIDQAVQLFSAVKGTAPTAAELQIIREQTYQQLQQEEQNSGNQQKPQGQGNEPQQQARPAVNNLTAVANALVEEAGFSIEPTDPEYKTIDQNTLDPNTFLTSVRKAIADKQARLGRPRSTAANIPGAVGSGGPSQSLAADYLKEKENIRRGDHMALIRLKNKYRSQGLDVEAAEGGR